MAEIITQPSDTSKEEDIYKNPDGTPKVLGASVPEAIPKGEEEKGDIYKNPDGTPKVLIDEDIVEKVVKKDKTDSKLGLPSRSQGWNPNNKFRPNEDITEKPSLGGFLDILIRTGLMTQEQAETARTRSLTQSGLQNPAWSQMVENALPNPFDDLLDNNILGPDSKYREKVEEFQKRHSGFVKRTALLPRSDGQGKEIIGDIKELVKILTSEIKNTEDKYEKTRIQGALTKLETYIETQLEKEMEVVAPYFMEKDPQPFNGDNGRLKDGYAWLLGMDGQPYVIPESTLGGGDLFGNKDAATSFSKQNQSGYGQFKDKDLNSYTLKRWTAEVDGTIPDFYYMQKTDESQGSGDTAQYLSTLALEMGAPMASNVLTTPLLAATGVSAASGNVVGTAVLGGAWYGINAFTGFKASKWAQELRIEIGWQEEINQGELWASALLAPWAFVKAPKAFMKGFKYREALWQMGYGAMVGGMFNVGHQYGRDGRLWSEVRSDPRLDPKQLGISSIFGLVLGGGFHGATKYLFRSPDEAMQFVTDAKLQVALQKSITKAETALKGLDPKDESKAAVRQELVDDIKKAKTELESFNSTNTNFISRLLDELDEEVPKFKPTRIFTDTENGSAKNLLEDIRALQDEHGMYLSVKHILEEDIKIAEANPQNVKEKVLAKKRALLSKISRAEKSRRTALDETEGKFKKELKKIKAERDADLKAQAEAEVQARADASEQFVPPVHTEGKYKGKEFAKNTKTYREAKEAFDERQKLASATGDEELPRFPEPWQMSLKEFGKPPTLPTPKEGNIILYHRVRNEEDLESILKEGLLLSKKQHQEGEGGTEGMWFSTNPKEYGEGRTIIAVEVPKKGNNKTGHNIEKANDTQYIVHNDISAQAIVWVDKKSSFKGSPDYRISKERGDLFSKHGGKIHKHYVEQAINEGKPVPQRVLDEYPDLKAKAEAEVQARADGDKVYYRGVQDATTPETREGRLLSFTEDENIGKIYTGKPKGDTAKVGEGAKLSKVKIDLKNPLDLRTADDSPLLTLKELANKLKFGEDKGITIDELKKVVEYLVQRSSGNVKLQKFGIDLNRLELDEGTSNKEALEHFKDAFELDSVNNYGDLSVDQYALADAPITKEIAERLGFDGFKHSDILTVNKKQLEATGAKQPKTLEVPDPISGKNVQTFTTVRPFRADQVTDVGAKPKASATGDGGIDVHLQDRQPKLAPFSRMGKNEQIKFAEGLVKKLEEGEISASEYAVNFKNLESGEDVEVAMQILANAFENSKNKEFFYKPFGGDRVHYAIWAKKNHDAIHGKGTAEADRFMMETTGMSTEVMMRQGTLDHIAQSFISAFKTALDKPVDLSNPVNAANLVDMGDRALAALRYARVNRYNWGHQGKTMQNTELLKDGGKNFLIGAISEARKHKLTGDVEFIKRANDGDIVLKDAIEYLQGRGAKDDMIHQLERLKAITDPATFIEQLTKHQGLKGNMMAPIDRFMKGTVEYYVNAILSHPATQTVSGLGNFANSYYQSATRAVGGAIDVELGKLDLKWALHFRGDSVRIDAIKSRILASREISETYGRTLLNQMTALAFTHHSLANINQIALVAGRRGEGVLTQQSVLQEIGSSYGLPFEGTPNLFRELTHGAREAINMPAKTMMWIDELFKQSNARALISAKNSMSFGKLLKEESNNATVGKLFGIEDATIKDKTFGELTLKQKNKVFKHYDKIESLKLLTPEGRFITEGEVRQVAYMKIAKEKGIINEKTNQLDQEAWEKLDDKEGFQKIVNAEIDRALKKFSPLREQAQKFATVVPFQQPLMIGSQRKEYHEQLAKQAGIPVSRFRDWWSLIEGTSAHIQRGRQGGGAMHSALQLGVPFVRTPYNIVSEIHKMLPTSHIPLLRKVLGGEKYAAMGKADAELSAELRGKMVIGAGIFYTGWKMVNADNFQIQNLFGMESEGEGGVYITGQISSDPKIRDGIQKNLGYQPYSFITIDKDGNHVNSIGYNRADPWFAILAWQADMRDYLTQVELIPDLFERNKYKEVLKAYSLAMGQASLNVLANRNYLQIIETSQSAIKYSEYEATKLGLDKEELAQRFAMWGIKGPLKTIGQGFVPAAFRKTRSADPYERDFLTQYEGFVEELGKIMKNAVPSHGSKNLTYYNELGEPVELQSNNWEWLVPARFRKIKRDPVLETTYAVYSYDSKGLNRHPTNPTRYKGNINLTLQNLNGKEWPDAVSKYQNDGIETVINTKELAKMGNERTPYEAWTQESSSLRLKNTDVESLNVELKNIFGGNNKWRPLKGSPNLRQALQYLYQSDEFISLGVIDKKTKTVLSEKHDKRTQLTSRVIDFYRDRSLDLVEDAYPWLKYYKTLKPIKESTAANDTESKTRVSTSIDNNTIQKILDFHNQEGFGNNFKREEE